MDTRAKRPFIAISQRVLTSGPGGYRSDVLDQAWFPFLDACGIRALAVPNSLADPETLIQELGLAGLILSGGNNLSRSVFPQLQELDDTAPERDRNELALVRAMQSAGLPVVGVCRGMQLLNLFHGGSISRVTGHVRNTHSLALERDFSVIAGVSEISTNSFHDWGIRESELAPKLLPWARAAEGTIEAFRHESLSHYGIMWHPEREPKDAEFNRNFFRAIWSLR